MKQREIKESNFRAIRVSIPAKVANNIDAFQKSFSILMDELGCPACCSGFDITFLQQRDYFFQRSPYLKNVAITQSSIDVSASRLVEYASGDIVNLSPATSYNLDRLLENVGSVLDELGCPACCSGFDLTFRQEFDVLFNESLEVRFGNELRG
ncbi:MAG: hypothetical protein AAFV93_15990 [Chloroflexota bacterium]